MIIENVISQHAEESAFLWLIRDSAVNEPSYTLEDLAHLEEQVDAHLDGLYVAGNAGWLLCKSALKQAESGEVFTASYTAINNSKQEWLDHTIEVVASAPETIRGIVSALGWLPNEKLRGLIVNWLQSDDSFLRLTGISACAINRIDCKDYLIKGIHDTNTALCARALRCVGELRRKDLLPAVSEHLESEDISCRFWAAWSATLLGDTEGLSVLQSFFEIESRFRQPSLLLGLRVMDKANAVNWVKEHTRKSGYERAIIEATGIVADPVTIPWLISLMQNPEFSRLAGESFTMITGVDLAYEDLDGDQPEGFEVGPTENPEDEDVAMDPDEELPWPDCEKVSDWWSQNDARFTVGERYLCGQPITRDQCVNVLKNGYQRQRRAAAIELALINQNEPLFNCSATAKEQMRLLGLT
ncbi:MAG: TIGR02270 family protein [Candidatus Thiodiazotropha sp.]